MGLLSSEENKKKKGNVLQSIFVLHYVCMDNPEKHYTQKMTLNTVFCFQLLQFC